MPESTIFPCQRLRIEISTYSWHSLWNNATSLEACLLDGTGKDLLFLFEDCEGKNSVGDGTHAQTVLITEAEAQSADPERSPGQQITSLQGSFTDCDQPLVWS